MHRDHLATARRGQNPPFWRAAAAALLGDDPLQSLHPFSDGRARAGACQVRKGAVPWAWVLGRRIFHRISSRLGGRARTRVIALLAAVLALDASDKGAVGAMARELEEALGVGKTELGLLLTATSLASALATLPYGWLADRVHRIRLLFGVILSWGVMMAASAVATTYPFLLATRIGLGLASAAALPVTASLIGDFFPAGERGRIFGYVIAGELVGTAFGLVVAGEAAALSWRAGFLALAAPAVLLAFVMARLPEPARGGPGQLREGQERVEATADTQRGRGESAFDAVDQLARDKVREARVPPRKDAIPAEDPQRKSLFWAVGYILRIPTSVLLIVVSGLGYYFYGGLRAFSVELLEQQFGLGPSPAVWTLALLGVGAITGVLAGGRAGDALLARGRLSGRVATVAVAFFAAPLFLAPGLLAPSLPLALPMLILGAAALGAANPPLDASRLDIMHPHLWGRSEALRTCMRNLLEGLAPAIFGWVAEEALGTRAHPALRETFLFMLIPLIVGSLVALWATRTYPRDVATADAYTRTTAGLRRDQ
jgi:predicted MFS family arabinose efflux permease